MKNRSVIFDLDGTLIDSLHDIALCANEVLKELGHPTYKIEKYKDFVGDGAKILMENAMPHHAKQSDSDRALKRFKEVYDLEIHNNTKPYDGIHELLKKLEEKKFKIGILSNKPHEFTIRYAKNLFSDINFHEVHGQKEHIPKKPEPVGAVNIAKSFDIPCGEIFYVGDTGTDMQTAKGAGMIAIGVLWGFRDEDELLLHGADYIVNNPNELWEILNSG